MVTRYFIARKNAFAKGTAYVVLSEGEVSLVMEDGEINDATLTEDDCLSRLKSGAWKEITCDEATNLLNLLKFEHEKYEEPCVSENRELWLDMLQAIRGFDHAGRIPLGQAWDVWSVAQRRSSFKVTLALQDKKNKRIADHAVKLERFPDAW